MKLSRIVQTYVGILSVFALALIGASAYIWQSGQISSSADEINQAVVPNFFVSLDSDTSEVAQGQEIKLTLNGDFQDEPIVASTVMLSYSTDVLEISTIETDSGILGKASEQIMDPQTGTATLVFQPLSGYSGVGSLGTITLKGKATGTGIVNIDLADSVDGTLKTIVSSPTKLNIEPVVFGSTITVK